MRVSSKLVSIFASAESKTRSATRGDSLRARSLRLEPLEERTVLAVSAGGHAGHDAAFESHLFDLERITFLPDQTHLFDLEAGYVGAPAAGDPLDVAIEYLNDNAQRLGISAADVASSVVTNQYVSSHTGVTHIYLAQTHNGLRVANTSININVGPDGRVINVGANFVPELTDGFAAGSDGFELTAEYALHRAAEQLGIKSAIAPVEVSPASGISHRSVFSKPTLSLDDIPVERFYVPTADGGVAASWKMVVRTPDGQHWFDLGVDAHSGDINSAADWVDYATYNVYPRPLEAPHDDPSGIASRSIVVDPHLPQASPFGWQDFNGVPGEDTTDTRGNNVFAQEDADGNDTGGFRPNGGAARVFNFSIDFTQEPILYVSASITNLFYWNNISHDIHYVYGFNEQAGNFQLNNYGKGGIQGDYVMADAQDGSGTNNANFQTPPDGQNPRMQQFIYTRSVPSRDSSLDNGIIVHEYGHGVSRRLTGGAADSSGLNALQSRGMGEGWSDWWSLMFAQNSSDTRDAGAGIGTYVSNQDIMGSGIRRVPYSFDKSIDPHTYGVYNIDNEFHAAGEIWASVLWDLNWLLIEEHGYEPDIAVGFSGPGSAGNLLALQLVMDGLKLQPANPTFLDGRDAILLADEILTGGENAQTIWTAFARRGMGASADDGGSPNSPFVREAFDLPLLGLTVVASDPAEVKVLTEAPVEFTLHFSTEYLPESVDAGDLTVNDIPADSFVLVDADTITFHFDASPVTIEGPQTMQVAAGALTQASNGEPGLAWEGMFLYDVDPLLVVSTSPMEGAVLTQRPNRLVFDFSDPLTQGSIDAGALSLSVGTASRPGFVDEDSITFSLGGLPTSGLVQYTLRAGAVMDTDGIPSPEYSGSFALVDPNMQRFESPHVPFPITDMQTTISGLTIARSATIVDLDVVINITHTFVGDLEATLVAPDGTPYRLFSFVGGAGDNFTETIFDDEANRPLAMGMPPFTGHFTPIDPFMPLDGTDMQGTWRLEVSDRVSGDQGVLAGWGLIVTSNVALTIEGDTNHDGVVNIEDLNNVRNHFGAVGDGVVGDTLPFDGDVDIDDLNAVRNNFGRTVSESLVASSVPDATAAPARLPLELAVERIQRQRRTGAVRPRLADLALQSAPPRAALGDEPSGERIALSIREIAHHDPASRLADSYGLSRRPLRRVTSPADVWDTALDTLLATSADDVWHRRR